MYLADDEIRRTDLELRCRYPELDTVIYKINMHEFVIECKNFQGDFADLKKEFNREIRIVASPVRLEKESPKIYETILPPIPWQNPVAEFRASAVTEQEVRNFVEARFPHLIFGPIIHYPGKDYRVEITVGEMARDQEIVEIQKILQKVLGTDQVTVKKEERKAESPGTEQENNDKEEKTYGQVFRLGFDRELPWAEGEAEYWFTYAEDIYENRICREQIPYYRAEQKNCFLDGAFGGSLDLRKVLLLYETVYLEMPIKEQLDLFLEKQRMTRKELVELVQMGKVVLVLTNLESRYDLTLLGDACKENPLGVLGRRGVNVLLAAYFSELERRYADHYPQVYELAREVYREGRKEKDPNLLKLANASFFPLQAKAQSFTYLNNNNVFSLGDYGVNRIFLESIQDRFTKDQQLYSQLLMQTEAYPIHLALALNGTYFPKKISMGTNTFTNYYGADFMEHLLSFYWYHPQDFSLLQKSRGQEGMEQLKLFQCEDSLSVLDIAKKADQWNTPGHFGELVSRFAAMNPPDREKRIREYNHLLMEIAQPEKNSLVTDLILTGSGFLPFFEQFSTGIELLSLLKKQFTSREPFQGENQKRKWKKQLEKKEQKTYDSQTMDDLYLLDRIYRVARLTAPHTF